LISPSILFSNGQSNAWLIQELRLYPRLFVLFLARSKLHPFLLKRDEDAVTRAIDPIHDQLLELAMQGESPALGQPLESHCALSSDTTGLPAAGTNALFQSSNP
jgi:hypothetical protein